jgi:hypothetical protein
MGIGEDISSAAPAGDGNMNYTLRVHTAKRSFIVKQAGPWVEKYPHIPAPCDRALMESQFYNAIQADEELARCMPRLIGFDPEARTLIMEDLGALPDFTSIYSDASISPAEIDSLTSFLTKLHSRFRDPNYAGRFANRDMRKLNHEHIFDFPLRNHPELARRIDRIIAVAGRRPGQHFLTGKATRPFRDFNFEMDPQAFQMILDSRVPLVLAPWEISSKVWLTRQDLERLAMSNPLLEWLTTPASDWLDFWKKPFDVDGFNPFDTLAVGYAIDPKMFRCESLPANIETLADDTDSARSKAYLLVAKDIDSHRKVEYCFEAQPGFKQDLMAPLMMSKHR